MLSYRSYRMFFMDRGGRIASVSDVNCAGDEQARSVASEMLDAQARHQIIEVWDRTRLVWRHNRADAVAGDDQRIAGNASSFVEQRRP